MSRWRLKKEAESSQAEWKSFAQLAEMLADGIADESELVQNDYQEGWVSIDAVPGLLKAALRLSRSRAIADLRTDPDKNIAPTSESIVHQPVVKSSGPLSQHTARDHGGSTHTAVLHRPLPLSLTVGVFVCIGGAAWLARYFWTQSHRFPVPQHLAEQPSGWSVPGLGPVSLPELMLLIFDGVVLLFLAFWFLLRRSK
jgi:hypothetical protein